MLRSFAVFPSTNFVDLGMYQLGHEACEPGHSFGPAARNHYLFHYVLSGQGQFMSNGSDGELHYYDIKSGQGFLIFPGQITTYVADARLPWEYIWFEFDGLRVRESLEIAGFSIDSPVYHPHDKDLRKQMEDELLYMAQHTDAPAMHVTGHFYLALDLLVRSQARSDVSTGSRLRDFYVKEALSYIENNFQNEISVEDIAKNSGLNRSYFGKIFRDAIGKTPQAFLLSYRMSKACELLKLTELSVGDIGSAVGYPNQLHFSRAFKSVYGIPPREWRNRNR